MGAYVALLSVSQVIESIIPHEHEYYYLCHEKQMESLHGNIVCLQQLIEDYYENSGSILDQLESRIVDVSYKIEDMIESDISCLPGTKCEWMKLVICIIPLWMRGGSNHNLVSAFGSCIEEVDSIMEEALKMKEISKNNNVLDRGHQTIDSSRSVPGENNIKVGLKEHLNQIMGRAIGHERTLQTIPIVGMGGIGKTTLARAVYEHQIMVKRFDVRLWTTVSQQYNIQEILQGLILDGETGQHAEVLIERLYKSLKGRRYLIVLDDMWHVEAWDGVRRAFPDDNNGSRVIFTTRLSDLIAKVDSLSPLHEMQFLNEDQSWELFCRKVNGQESCPREFEEIGKDITRSCKGFPLAIVVIAGLVKFNNTLDYWKKVARNISAAATNQLIEILSLSYTNLPPHLKSCFLYLGSFPEDREIPTKRLILLWVAEGFIKASRSKSSEEVAEEYVEDLVNRNLVMVAKKRSNGKIKTLIVHDVVRELSIKKAQREFFSKHLGDYCSLEKDAFEKIIRNLRRINVAFGTLLPYPVDTCNTSVRSVLNFDEYYDHLSSIIAHFRRLKVLEGVVIRLSSTPRDIFYPRNLRHLHILLTVNRDSVVTVIPESIFKLQNLATLIISSRGDRNKTIQPPSIRRNEIILTSNIWRMPQLKHIFLTRNITVRFPSLFNHCALDKLQSLSWVENINFTKRMTRKIPNLKILKIDYTTRFGDAWVHFGLNNLVHLHKLKDLSIDFTEIRYTTDPPHHFGNLTFAQNLKKLTLRSTNFHWEQMSAIGSLPDLQVLNLLINSFIGEEWEPIKGEFLQLKYLKMSCVRLLRYWRAESEHFPLLETLIISYCDNLEEVPSSIGEIDTLQKVIIRDCNENLEQSVRRIKEKQESYGNYALQIVLLPS